MADFFNHTNLRSSEGINGEIKAYSNLPPSIPASAKFSALDRRLNNLLTAYEISVAPQYLQPTSETDPDQDLYDLLADDEDSASVCLALKGLKARIRDVRALYNKEWSQLVNAHIPLLSDPSITLFVAVSGIKNAGKGLYTRNEVPINHVVCCYHGSIHSIQSFREECQDKSYGILLPLQSVEPAGPAIPFSLPPQTRDVIIEPSDLALYENVPARYINDPRSPAHYNCVFKPSIQHLCAFVVTTRRIAAGEELFVAYGDVYWSNQSYEPQSLSGTMK